ncbi:MAG: DUF2313 domain-containing protein [Ruminococcus sp.]|nr:DUF2313 domain-containing protein [Ruminococcus sp.]
MMTVFERLRASLSPVGIYDSDAEVLSVELKAYADELELLYDQLGAMFRERFIETAQDAGLAAYESMFGPVRSEESVEGRRAMLQLRMNLGGGDFTPAGIRRALDSLGLEYTISEFPHIGKLNVTATADYTQAQQIWIRREVEKIVPAHVEFQLTFNSLTWAQIDAFDRTYQTIDGADLTWAQIDNRTY